MWRISQRQSDVMWTQERKWRRQEAGDWGGKEGKKRKVKPATDLLFDSFQAQTPKDQRASIPERAFPRVIISEMD